MKRVAFAVLGTIGGLVGLLSFKTHVEQPIAAQLPSAGSATPAPTGSAPTGSAPTGSAGSAPTGSAADGSATSRTLTGSAQSTRYGTVQVRVTMTGSRIDDVAFVQLTARDSRSRQINAAAAPVLLRETLAAQSADIDAVSGATYTSDGYERSLQSALDQA